MRTVEALAAAKLNLSLVVKSPRRDGLHPVAGRFQSVDWLDRLVIEPGAEPGVAGFDGRPVVAGEDNLAWIASQRVVASLEAEPVAVRLDKQIPVAAGLGGGSADAAAALAATAWAVGGTLATVVPLAAGLGSDVPFCLVGGCADVSGVGERVRPTEAGRDYAVALVVPPFEVATAAVYSAWDLLGEPHAAPMPESALPPSLRNAVAVRNDLTDAAIAVAPDIAAWRAELEAGWSRPVGLSGSGPTLFSFFLDRDEAEAALEVAPTGARHTRAVVPIEWGWAVRFEGADGSAELMSLHEPGDHDPAWHVARPGVVVSALV